MNRRKNNKGFTMAELILVVAIIAVLAALVFVGVTRYLRSLRLMEMDNAAKEMYFAAQNRMTASLVSGDLGRLKDEEYSADEEKKLTVDGENVKLHVVVVPNPGNKDNTLLDELLPFGSIDETIRGGGSYIITYTFDAENNLADVWDVWYTAEWRGVKHEFKRSEIDVLYASTRGDANKDTRKNYGSDKAVIGHYGSKGVSITRQKLAVKFELKNEEVLYLTGKVTDDKGNAVPANVNPQVNLIVEGRTSGARVIRRPEQNGRKWIELNDDGTFSFVLDDVTAEGKRFRDQFKTDDDDATKAFIPGEDIRVTVEVYSNDTLANIDRATAVDNSLFQYVNTKADGGKIEAGIGKVRHLQNLSSDVSNVDYNNDKLKINKALQTDDLTWVVEDNEHNIIGGFLNFTIDGTTKLSGNIVYNDGAITKQTDKSFHPINMSTELVYEAGYKDNAGKDKRHAINNLVVSGADHAGLFGKVSTPDGSPLTPHGKILLTVQNLEMNGANMTGTETAGAIIANEVNAARLSNITISAAAVTATGGNAGGAVGKAANGLDLFGVNLTGTSSVTATGNAGGLLGDFNATDTDSHLSINALIDSSGTEKKVTNYSSVGDKDSGAITVSSTGENMAAGGLVGAITKGYPQIDNSFSTALVSGYTAGGLIGAVGSDCDDRSYVRNCYVGGHVINDAASGMPVYDKDNFNITGTNIAGGFIGTSATENLAVSNSYTTASAQATGKAGGFYGSGAGIEISNCYATGLVNADDPTKAGAFSGTDAVSLTAPNYYFELVNPNMPAIAGQTQATGISAVESNLDSYTKFFMLREEGTFFPYNNSDATNITSLKKMFGTRYFLPTVHDLDSNATLTTHVGDWQPVDTLVTNTPDGG